jgi:hypothetical protein
MTEPTDLPLSTLPDGTTVPTVTLRTTMMSLRRLCETNPVAAYELVEICRDPGHEPFGDTGEVLQRLGLVHANGRVHDDTRAVVLASMSVDEVGVTLKPVA